MGLCRVCGGSARALTRISGTLLPEPCRWLLSDEPRQTNQVVRGTTEDEQPVHFLQPSQLYLTQWAGLLQPAEALFHQPAAAQADGIAEVPGRPAIQIAAPPFFVLCNMRSNIQLTRRADEILAVVSLVSYY